MRDRSSVVHTSTVRPAHPLAESDEASPPDSDISRHTTVQTVFQDITRTFGISFVPELFEGMRHRPAYLDTTWTLFKDELNLECRDRRTKRVIALAISTNEAGVFFIAAMPGAFCLNALDPATCDKVLSTIRFLKAFDRYLSGIMPAVASDAVTFVHDHLREEYLSYEATRVSQLALSREDNQEASAEIVGRIIVIALLSCVMGIYWFTR
ncbi:MAG: hypothetical protein ABS70_00150 [Nitrospira sp. SCN 59-13]|nr:MAG: hypothetical protein ABS70_00150 [Nitrospira sp. SCN 59-13]